PFGAVHYCRRSELWSRDENGLDARSSELIAVASEMKPFLGRAQCGCAHYFLSQSLCIFGPVRWAKPFTTLIRPLLKKSSMPFTSGELGLPRAVIVNCTKVCPSTPRAGSADAIRRPT